MAILLNIIAILVSCSSEPQEPTASSDAYETKCGELISELETFNASQPYVILDTRAGKKIAIRHNKVLENIDLVSKINKSQVLSQLTPDEEYILNSEEFQNV